MTTKPQPLTEKEIEDRVQKIMLELQIVLANNTKDGNSENAFILLSSAVQLYTMVSKQYVNSRENFLYNSGLAWDTMNKEDFKEVVYQ